MSKQGTSRQRAEAIFCKVVLVPIKGSGGKANLGASCILHCGRDRAGTSDWPGVCSRVNTGGTGALEFYTVVTEKSQGWGTLRNADLEVHWAPSSVRDMIQDPQWMLKLQSTKPYMCVCVVVCAYTHSCTLVYTHICILLYTHTHKYTHTMFFLHTRTHDEV